MVHYCLKHNLECPESLLNSITLQNLSYHCKMIGWYSSASQNFQAYSVNLFMELIVLSSKIININYYYKIHSNLFMCFINVILLTQDSLKERNRLRT